MGDGRHGEWVEQRYAALLAEIGRELRLRAECLASRKAHPVSRCLTFSIRYQFDHHAPVTKEKLVASGRQGTRLKKSELTVPYRCRQLDRLAGSCRVRQRK